jgi:hypothetical protein
VKKDEDEVVTLVWGQKVFSKAEFRSGHPPLQPAPAPPREYNNAKEEDFEAPMKKKLVCDARRLLAEGHVPKNRVSTRVEGEAGEEEDASHWSPVTTDPREEPSVVALLMREGARRRRGAEEDSAGGSASHSRSWPGGRWTGSAPCCVAGTW